MRLGLGRMQPLRRPSQIPNWLAMIVVIVSLLGVSFVLGQRASPLRLGLLAASVAVAFLLVRPVASLFALVLAALIVPIEISTGTEVSLYSASALLPVLLVAWLLAVIRQPAEQFISSPINRPLLLFLVAGILSLVIGRATWDPAISVGSNFLLVQLAQWAVFALSAGALWLSANLVRNERLLWQLTATFLLLAGTGAVLLSVPALADIARRYATSAFIRAPLYLLLAAVAGGQLFFNHRLRLGWRLFLVVALGGCMTFALTEQREVASNWLGISVSIGVLVWLRLPRLRPTLLGLMLALIATNVIWPTVYSFAGGDAEWLRSGGSRLALTRRVVEVTMRNPLTGLGPAAYRPYANSAPLVYGQAVWTNPTVNSHNNYADIFSHVGIIGLALFGWFVVELGRLSLRLRKLYHYGFAAGYVNGMIAAGVSSLAIMVLADWILPFVYNVSFAGFQASVLVWLFIGGLVALDNMSENSGKDAQQ